MAEQKTQLPFTFSQTLTLSTVGTEVSALMNAPQDTDFVVTHVDLTLYSRQGGVEENLLERHEIQISIEHQNSGNQYFNALTDFFLLRRLCRSAAFRPFVIARNTQLNVRARIDTFVNSGVFLTGVGAYKVNIAFIGYKISQA